MTWLIAWGLISLLQVSTVCTEVNTWSNVITRHHHKTSGAFSVCLSRASYRITEGLCFFFCYAASFYLFGAEKVHINKILLIQDEVLLGSDCMTLILILYLLFDCSLIALWLLSDPERWRLAALAVGAKNRHTWRHTASAFTLKLSMMKLVSPCRLR